MNKSLTNIDGMMCKHVHFAANQLLLREVDNVLLEQKKTKINLALEKKACLYLFFFFFFIESILKQKKNITKIKIILKLPTKENQLNHIINSKIQI